MKTRKETESPTSPQKRRKICQELNVIVSSIKNKNLEELEQEVISLTMKKTWISYPYYLLAWLLVQQNNKNEKLADELKVWELRMPLKNPDETCLVEGRTDIRRILFIFQNNEDTNYKDVATFCAIFDEYASQKTTYVAFLEKSGFPLGSSVIKPVLRSYAEYISLVADHWTLQIWADPPEPGKNFIFRNKLHDVTKPGPNASELRKMYQSLLEESGFTGEQYKWLPNLPPLPQFGLKNESSTHEKLNEFKQKILSYCEEFNAELFKNTHTALLTSRLNSHYFKTQEIEKIISGDIKPLSETDFINDEEIDFSSLDKAISSSNKIKRICNNYIKENKLKFEFLWRADVGKLYLTVDEYYLTIAVWMHKIK